MIVIDYLNPFERVILERLLASARSQNMTPDQARSMSTNSQSSAMAALWETVAAILEKRARLPK